ncbi:hypothetical protein BaRGS_00032475, partial [Batillaria attramentaria]
TRERAAMTSLTDSISTTSTSPISDFSFLPAAYTFKTLNSDSFVSHSGQAAERLSNRFDPLRPRFQAGQFAALATRGLTLVTEADLKRQVRSDQASSKPRHRDPPVTSSPCPHAAFLTAPPVLSIENLITFLGHDRLGELATQGCRRDVHGPSDLTELWSVAGVNHGRLVGTRAVPGTEDALAPPPGPAHATPRALVLSPVLYLSSALDSRRLKWLGLSTQPTAANHIAHGCEVVYSARPPVFTTPCPDPESEPGALEGNRSQGSQSL